MPSKPCMSDQIQQQMDAQPTDAAPARCPSNYFGHKGINE